MHDPFKQRISTVVLELGKNEAVGSDNNEAQGSENNRGLGENAEWRKIGAELRNYERDLPTAIKA